MSDITFETPHAEPHNIKENLKVDKIFELKQWFSCNLKCSYCPSIGALNYRKSSKEELYNSIKNAVLSDYKYVSLSCAGIFSTEYIDIIKLLYSKNLIPILQINSGSINDSVRARLEKTFKYNPLFNIIGSQFTKRQLDTIKLLDKSYASTYYTLIVTKQTNYKEEIAKFSEAQRKKLYFYFPYNVEKLHYNYHEVIEVIEDINNHYDGFQVQFTPFMELVNDEIPEAAILDENRLPIFQQSTEKPEIKQSIVLLGNHIGLLKESVLSLVQQNYDKNKYEFIIVTKESIANDVIQFLQKLNANITLLSFQRDKKIFFDLKPMPAALNYNYAAKYTRGTNIIFFNEMLKADESFLKQLDQQLPQDRVFRIQRENIYDNKFSMGLKNLWGDPISSFLDAVSIPTSLFNRMGGYKKQFYNLDFYKEELFYRMNKEAIQIHTYAPKIKFNRKVLKLQKIVDAILSQKIFSQKETQYFCLTHLDKELFYKYQWAHKKNAQAKFLLKVTLKNIYKSSLIIRFKDALGSVKKKIKSSVLGA